MKDRHKNRGGHNKIDLTNRVFGKLTVIKDTGRRKSKRPIWLCKCECGKEVEINGKYLLCGDTQSCGCITKGNAHNRAGFKTLGESYVTHVKNAAKRRGIPFEINAEDMYNKIEEQNFKCAMTGEKIDIVLNYHDERLNQTASLDRINSNKGYTKDNIQWVHKIINIMKNKYSTDEFVKWCNKVTNYQLN